MYWVAHLVYLVSPFVARLEPVDDRIILSLLGLRFIDIQMNFMYLNAAWWYFAMLIQFYLIFPLLFWAARQLGALAVFANRVRRWIFRALPFARCSGRRTDCGCSADSRFVGCPNLHSGCRSRCGCNNAVTSARGMVPPSRRWIRRWTNSLSSVRSGLRPLPYIFVDFATGACCLLEIVGSPAYFAISDLCKTVGLVGLYSYGLYLIHQPYVIWLGLRIREVPVWAFLLICIPVLAVLAAWACSWKKELTPW